MRKADRSAVLDQGRLFESFFDSVDMIASFPAHTKGIDVNHLAANYCLRYPLFVDEEESIQAHIDAIEFAPESSRFGAFVDNITGMNWELPDGRCVRIGDRVVKSTTGYDLLRFLLHSGTRFGRPIDYVLRLRPLGGEEVRGKFLGEKNDLEATYKRLESDSWVHWINRMDWVSEPNGETRVEVMVECMPGEADIFVEHFFSVADGAGVQFEREVAPPDLRLPDLTAKTTVSEAIPFAEYCRDAMSVRVRVLLQCGVVYIEGGMLTTEIEQNEKLSEMVEPYGGHLYGSKWTNCKMNDSEFAWVTSLQKTWETI